MKLIFFSCQICYVRLDLGLILINNLYCLMILEYVYFWLKYQDQQY